MNKFKNLASKLIKGDLWCTRITYIITQQVKQSIGLPSRWVQSDRFQLLVTVTSVNRTLIDNINILPTDRSLLIASDQVQPKIEDLIEIGNDQYKIIRIIPLGTIDGQPTCYQLLVRLG